MNEQTELVTLTIDGQSVSVPKGSVIWAAAKALDIEVPIYCYHPKMDPLGACRMCFVEVEKMPKLATACTTVVSEGMVVRTDTAKVKKGRQGTLEFLLINHPLDCPICDKGGECDLQDFTLRHGPGDSRFDLSKRHFPKPIPVSENILLDRERCIACQRCVRFCQDVAMENGLVMRDRGFKTEVGVEPEAPFVSIFSGNVVEMCPVGALTAKNYRFVSRPWELRKTASVCANCAVGCNVRVDVRVNRVQRQYSRTNDAIDDGWLCDRGRWDLDAFNSAERLTAPLVRRDGKLVAATWDEAIAAAAGLLRDVKQQRGAQAIGGIGSTHTTNEEAYLFQKLLRSLGANSIDHYHGRFPPQGPRDLPWVWTDSIAGLDSASHIVLLGTDVYHRQPVIDLRIRKAIRRGARISVLTSAPDALDRYASQVVRYSPGQTGTIARTLLQVILSEGLTRGAYAERQRADLIELRKALADDTPERAAQVAGVDAEALRTLARELAAAPGAELLYDEMATREPTGATLAADVLLLAQITDNFGRIGAGAGPLFEDNNSLGARDMGVLPDMLPGYRPAETVGLDYDAMLAGGVSALYVMRANPAQRLADTERERLASLDALIVQDLFLTETAELAHVVFPALSAVEKEGAFTNTERAIQVVRKAMVELPGARADWEILAALANALGLGWSYLSPVDVLREIGRTVPLYAGVSRRGLGTTGARWPLLSAASAADGRTTLTGSPFLTWEMLENGVAAAQSTAASASGQEG